MLLGFFGSIVVLALLFLWMSVNIVNEYQRLVVFRLGRLVAARGPGLVLIIPLIERAVRMPSAWPARIFEHSAGRKRRQ